MRPITIHIEEVIRTLETHKVLRTDELIRKLSCSPRTLYLKLSQCKYISSINQSRRFITFTTTPEYDSNGLWEHREAIFSKWGGIKETIMHLINSSIMGLTPSQINKNLKTTVTPQLLACLKEKKVVRLRYGRNQVYFSIDKVIQKKQIKQYEQHKIKKEEISIDTDIIIRILIAIIKHREMDPLRIKTILESEGIKAKEKEILLVFKKYEIEKKGSLSK